MSKEEGRHVNGLGIGILAIRGLCWAYAWTPVSTREPAGGQAVPRVPEILLLLLQVFKTFPRERVSEIRFLTSPLVPLTLPGPVREPPFLKIEPGWGAWGC